MRFGRRVCFVWLLAGVAPATLADEAKTAPPKPAAASAATPKPAMKPVTKPAPAVEDDFLEFLGSIDAEGADEDWMDYLARTDIEKVAKAKKAPDTEVKK